MKTRIILQDDKDAFLTLKWVACVFEKELKNNLDLIYFLQNLIIVTKCLGKIFFYNAKVLKSLPLKDFS